MKNLKFLLRLTSSAVLTTGAISTAVACNQTTNSAIDISNVTVNNMQLEADTTKTYSDLNDETQVIDAVANAISSAKDINNPVENVDFTITNNMVDNDNQSYGQSVQFTVTGMGENLTGSFMFTVTLSIPNIGIGVNVNNQVIPANVSATYASLNNNQTLINAVISAINAAKDITITQSDFVLSNDHEQQGNQVQGTRVKFTVTGVGNNITGNFNFNATIGAADLSTIVIPDQAIAANPSLTYQQLNSANAITQIITNAIQTQLNITGIKTNEYTVTNDQIATSNQTVGQTVIVTVSGNSARFKNNFTFNVNLVKVNISNGVTVPDLKTIPNSAQTFASLNTNTAILNAVVNAINSAKKTTITTADIVLTNDQTATGTQVGDRVVTFTVQPSATAKQITGSFTFVDTLTKFDITNVTLADPKLAVDTGSTYGNLNNDSRITNAVVNAINTTFGSNITANDVTITNDQTAAANQVAGTAMKFTVTAKGPMTGSFTFTNTLQLPNITNLNITNATVAAAPTATYSALNTNTAVQTTIVNAINNTFNANVTASDLVITNDQSATANQTAGQAVKFTVTPATGSTKLTGTYTFNVTLAKTSINAVTITDPKSPVISGVFGDLNTNPTILAIITNAINTATAASVTASDYTVTNNQVATTQIGAAPVVFTVTANATSTKITGSFTFINTLQRLNINANLSYGSIYITPNGNRNTYDINTTPAVLAYAAKIINGFFNNTISVSTIPKIDFYLTNNGNGGAQSFGTSYTMTINIVQTSKLIYGAGVLTFVVINN